MDSFQANFGQKIKNNGRTNSHPAEQDPRGGKNRQRQDPRHRVRLENQQNLPGQRATYSGFGPVVHHRDQDQEYRGRVGAYLQGEGAAGHGAGQPQAPGRARGRPGRP